MRLRLDGWAESEVADLDFVGLLDGAGDAPGSYGELVHSAADALATAESSTESASSVRT